MTPEYSIQKMVSDGTLSTIALGIQYLQRNDIYIRIAGEETPQSGAPSGYTWSFVDNTTIKILPVVPNGVEVVVYRRTDADSMYNVYSQNAQFDEATVDENNTQLLFLSQEYLEQGSGIEAVEYLRSVGNVHYYRLQLYGGRYTAEFTITTQLPPGYERGVGDFVTGFTVMPGMRNVVWLNPSPAGDNNLYSWSGEVPPTGKVVPPNSTPETTGGFVNAWVPRTDETLRGELYGAGGAGLIGGLVTPITASHLAGGAIPGQDSTSAIEAAGTIGGTYYVPKGTYILTSAKIMKSVTFIFEEGAEFKRASGLDVRQSYWNDGVPMIDAAADGLTITFIDPVFDGNRANQPAVQVGYSGPDATTEPAGWAFRYYPRNAVTAKNCRFNFIRPRFKNGTSGYILVRGDDINRRFKTEIFLDDPIFTDTIYGYGKNDPATPAALGWNSDYINIRDYVDLYGSNVQMTYSVVPTPVGRYAPVGIRATYYSTEDVAGGASVLLFGKTVLRGMGRKSQSYDGANFTNSNGIGAIDGYGEAQDVYVEFVDGELCEHAAVRAKATIDTYHVGKANLKNCKRGLQVSPGTGVGGSHVTIGEVVSIGGTNPQVEIVGSTQDDRIQSLELGNCHISGGTNEEGLVSNIAGIVIRNTTDVTTGFLTVKNQDAAGIQFVYCSYVKSAGSVEDVANDGVILDTISDFVDADFSVKNAGGRGGYGAGACKSFRARFIVDGAKDYGFQANHTAGSIALLGCKADNITGVSRGFYMGSAGGAIRDSYVGAGVTTPLTASASTTLTIVQENNSWTPRNNMYSPSINAPTTGTYRRGDITYIPASAAGFIGWVCTVAGVAGSTAVFKRFGAIEA